ncbi:carboxypeptidase N subunit 2-like [Notolabrus celidotus]|uniref:carboxypeptidase N subunit 2-like n=1 Tax=Notolabrus celidotus TaxID=1203425 RepID=UPI00148F7186|nr:carboxypeptidase N subunit 2-like [Notolabrus celidotus]
MGKKLGLVLFLVLLLCHKGNLQLQTLCPYRCQCFTPVQVLCADSWISALPRNMSGQVTEFILMTSSVAHLFPNTLEESPQLTKLIFLSNVLRSIHSQAFAHLNKLQELEISGNPLLDHLYLGTFSEQENLTKLLLNYNKFKTVLPGMFDSLKQLESLQMKYNLISDLPAFIFLKLNNLHALDLSQNKLKELKRETFAGLERLETLKINYNLISNLTADTFHNMSQLIELHLEGNTISELADGIFQELTNLKELNLRGNLLTTFSSKVFGLQTSNLKELNLKGNRLTELSSISSLIYLTDLIVSSNQLSYLPEGIFRNFTTLENLDLSENQLSSLPETIFHDLFAIKTVYLNKNNLSKVEANLFQDQLLMEQLYLSDNQLETVPFGLLDPFIMQYTVRLHGNPWKCDCHMFYLHDWVEKNSLGIEMLDRVLCDSPGFLRRQTITSINKDHLMCRVSTDNMPDLNSCSIQSSNDTVTIKCKADKSSFMTVKVQFEEDDGRIKEHVLTNKPGPSEFGDGRTAESPLE